MIKEIISIGLILFALFFSLIGVIGLYRLNDAYQRLHVTSKFNLFALSALLLVAGFMVEDISWPKIILTFVLTVIASPLTSHIIASAAFERGTKFSDLKVKDSKLDL